MYPIIIFIFQLSILLLKNLSVRVYYNYVHHRKRFIVGTYINILSVQLTSRCVVCKFVVIRKQNCTYKISFSVLGNISKKKYLDTSWCDILLINVSIATWYLILDTFRINKKIQDILKKLLNIFHCSTYRYDKKKPKLKFFIWLYLHDKKKKCIVFGTFSLKVFREKMSN